MSVFTLKETVTLRDLAEQARIRSVQTRALADVINRLSDDQDSFQDRAQFVAITNLMWLLQDLLEQQEMLCEELGSSVYAQAKQWEAQA